MSRGEGASPTLDELRVAFTELLDRAVAHGEATPTETWLDNRVLDAIERAAIRDKKMPLEVFHLARAVFGQKYADADLALWVERFYKLWCINQWKRERYAPSFHLDDENLDPKTWCRFPILSGNFERELAEMRAYVATLVPVKA